MRQILFVINPISGGLDKSQTKAEIETYCQTQDWSFNILETTGTDDDRRIADAIDEYEPDTVVAGGGDGTVNLVARTVLGRSDCQMGILPLGSANGLASELGISSNVAEALEVLHQGRTVAMDALCIQGDHYCFHLADIGYNAQLVQHFARDETTRGRIGYARELFRTVRQRPVGRFEITVDGTSFTQWATMITFANGQRYGTGAFVNPHGAIDDGHFEVCVFQPWPRWYSLWIVLLSFLGRVNESKWVKIQPATRATVVAHPALPLQADGEPLGRPTRVSVDLVSEKVPLWIPN